VKMFNMMNMRALSLRMASVVLSGSVATFGMTGAANATTANAPRFSKITVSAVKLTNLAGFAHISQAQFKRSAQVTAIPLAPGLIVNLGSSDGETLIDPTAGVAITDSSAGGSATVVKANASGFGFGITTTQHARLEYHYKTVLAPGTTIKPAADGGLNELNSAGEVIGHISPAYAIDSTGARIPASYGFNSRNNELVVKANTTHARGAVFIDPSWHCWVTASFYGAAAIVAAAAWIFTDGTAAWVAWALRAWFGLSINAANSIARACAAR
jgi:hypothetical protein